MCYLTHTHTHTQREMTRRTLEGILHPGFPSYLKNRTFFQGAYVQFPLPNILTHAKRALFQATLLLHIFQGLGLLFHLLRQFVVFLSHLLGVFLDLLFFLISLRHTFL